jgi:hypothetical protein
MENQAVREVLGRENCFVPARNRNPYLPALPTYVTKFRT